MQYRPDIDGLRALAIVPVVLFHAGLDAVPGGFIGVDVFFVISGYLITTLILQDLQNQTFSILSFYERRARRILPALLTVVAASLITGAVIMLPDDFAQLSVSALFTTVFASNVYFWQHAGYFAGPSELFPLLHTWSLAVEEQFYIGFPILLLLLTRVRSSATPIVIGAICLLSLVLSVWAVRNVPGAAFYLIPTRIWELGVGALLAIWLPAQSARPAWREIAAAAGLVAIAAPMVVYSSATAFPGLAALPPVLGTAALIWAGAGTGQNGQPLPRINQILTARPLVFLGLISYSLYLWHWPILSFARYVGGDLSPVTTLACIIASVLVAALSWRYIERPFRNRQTLSRKAVFGFASLASVGVVVASALIYASGGVPSRINPGVLALAAGAHDVSAKGRKCLHLGSDPDTPESATCQLGPAGQLGKSAKHRFMLIGDSHAAAIVPAFESAARKNSIVGQVVTTARCLPLDNVVIGHRAAPDHAHCRNRNAKAIRDAVASPDMKLVVLAAYWDGYDLTSTAYDHETGQSATNRTEITAQYMLGLERMIGKLTKAGKQVLVLHDLPDPNFIVPQRLAISKMWDGGAAKSVAHEPTPVTAAIETLARKYGASVLSMAKQLCSPGSRKGVNARQCPLLRNGVPLYSDDNHLSVTGAKLFGEALARKLANLN